MSDPEVVRVARRFAAALLARERAQMQAMVDRYLAVQDRLQTQIDALTDEIARLQEAGETVSLARIERLERYRSLQAQIAVELQRYEGYADGLISSEQRAYIDAAMDSAAEKLAATGATLRANFDRLAPAIAEAVVGLTADGTPISRLLAQAYPDAAMRIRDELAHAVVQGINPRETARTLRDSLGVGLDRILTIARTEQLRAYRLGEQTAWQHSGVVERYQRLASKDERTCIACLAVDGEVFPIDVPLDDHPRGRCTMLPVPIGSNPHRFETGAEWFARQDEATQIRIAGPTRTRLFRQGRISVREMAVRRSHPVWGGAWVPRPVRELQGLLLHKSAAGTDVLKSFQPCSSLAECADFLSGDLGITSVTFSSLHEPERQLAIANRLLAVLEEARSRGWRMPDAVSFESQGSPVAHAVIPPPLVGPFSPQDVRTMIAVDPGHSYWNDPVTRATHLYASGFASSADPSHAFRHEIGHHLHWLNLRDTASDVSTLLERWETTRTDIFPAQGTPELESIAQHVSRYATVDSDEFVAEVFAGLWAGNVYPQWIMHLFDEIGGVRF